MLWFDVESQKKVCELIHNKQNYLEIHNIPR